ncbi:hypothetical protein [Oribacterium sp. WCC10]|uniref:hypothetical protein n=1 Tax=Oribacterium sp. WCC10 TaxID=1855343 RepID=UPI0008E9EC39|nr:hypothetical protein [Oribacterium sp. WCC10]SFG07315.1 hypothetical protein SAMN05216356_101105 [Oribacterium sp. WCC10]
MKLIEKTDIMHIGFLKKESYTGSSEGMRYRMSKIVYHDPDTELLKKIEAGEADYPVDKKTGEKNMNPTKDRFTLGVWTWPEPFSFEKTPEEKKHFKELDFTEDGVTEGLEWLNAEKQSVDWGEAAYSWRDWKDLG